MALILLRRNKPVGSLGVSPSSDEERLRRMMDPVTCSVLTLGDSSSVVHALWTGDGSVDTKNQTTVGSYKHS